MPIAKVAQPERIEIDDTLRLRKYDGNHDFALSWYQDVDMVYLVDGVKEPYSPGKLNGMYRYLNDHGELYFIEILENGCFCPIGDVTFWQEDMPIVIGEARYRGKGIGRKIVAALVERGRHLGYSRLYVNEIYHHNTASRKCFESVGFQVCEETESGVRLALKLS